MPLNPIRVSVPLKTVAFALLVGALAVTPLAPVYAQKTKPAPKPAPNQAVTLTMADRTGDLVTSDGTLTYFNGAEGVSAYVYAASGDLVVTFSTSRHIRVALGTPLPPLPGQIQGPVPAPGTYEARRLYVNDIKGVAFGQPEKRTARILDFPSLPNHVVGFLETHNSLEEVGGTQVCVTRTSDVSWTIATANTDVEPNCVPDGIGGLFTQVNGRKGTIVITPLATYALPFSATVQLQ